MMPFDMDIKREKKMFNDANFAIHCKNKQIIDVKWA